MNEQLSNLNKAVDSLSEQKKRLDIALFYTHNDMEKAKNMISGVYKDLYAIKIKFSASTTFGGILFFFNIPYSSLMNSLVIISHSYLVDDLKTKLEWREFEKQMDELNKSGNHDNEMTAKMKSELAQAFIMQLGANQRGNELKKYLELNDEIAANRVIKKFITDKFGFQNINLSVDYQQISSLDMEIYSTSSKKIDMESSHEKEKKKEEPGIEPLEDEEEDIDKKEAQLILRGNLILSPVKGKIISSLVVGDRIRINLDSANSKAITVAKAFNAYDDGNILPITCRIVSIRRLLEGGYKIYCILAKGIYVRIDEEEESIRIATEITEESVKVEGSHTSILIALAFVFFVLVAVALVLLLK